MGRPHSRTASLVISLLSCAAYTLCALWSLSVWRSLNWDMDSEWEGSAEPWNLEGLKLVSAIVVAYFAFAAVACLIGFWGIVQSAPAKVRFYQAYSIADFVVSFIGTGVVLFLISNAETRTEICGQLSSRPEVLRDWTETGLTLENCEPWLEKQIFGAIGVMGVLLMLRAHCLVALSVYYRRLCRRRGRDAHLSLQSFDDGVQLERVLLLPGHRTSSRRQIVYAPVSLSEEDARQLNATEAWIAPSAIASASLPSPQDALSSRIRRHRHEPTGRIVLPIRLDEGLLPVYEETDPAKLL